MSVAAADDCRGAGGRGGGERGDEGWSVAVDRQTTGTKYQRAAAPRQGASAPPMSPMPFVIWTTEKERWGIPVKPTIIFRVWE